MLPSVGERAPDFTAPDQDGNPVRLSDYRGQKVILYFYPRDNTKGCTAQACNFRDQYPDLQQQGYEVLGVSSDGEQSHQKFRNKYDLPFTLIADPEAKVHKLYGVWQEKSMYGKTYLGTARTTFVIDEEGMITQVVEKVKTKDPVAQLSLE